MRLGLFIALSLGALTPVALTVPIATSLECLPVDSGAAPPPEPQCLRLAYSGARGHERYYPARLRLLSMVLPYHISQTVYRAEYLSRDGDWRQPLWWTCAGRDSMDIVYHHVPVLRLPMRGDTLIGRVSGQIGYTFFGLLIARPEPKVRAIRVPCP